MDSEQAISRKTLLQLLAFKKKKRKKSLGHLKRKSIYLRKEVKLDYQTFDSNALMSVKNNMVTYLRHLRKSTLRILYSAKLVFMYKGYTDC